MGTPDTDSITPKKVRVPKPEPRSGTYWLTTHTTPDASALMGFVRDRNISITNTVITASGIRPGEQTTFEISTDYEEEDVTRLVTKLHDDTYFSSFAEDRIEHAAFGEICDMGESAIPALFKAMDEYPYVTILLVAKISGEDPIPAAMAGNIDQMAESWRKWAIQKGHLTTS